MFSIGMSEEIMSEDGTSHFDRCHSSVPLRYEFLNLQHAMI